MGDELKVVRRALFWATWAANHLADPVNTATVADGLAALSRLEAQQPLQAFVDEHFEWASAMFPDETLTGKLIHLRKEVDEVAADPTDLKEWADCGMLLLHSLKVAGYTVAQFEQAMRDKFAEVRLRKTWIKTPEGDYQSVKVVPAPASPEGERGEQQYPCPHGRPSWKGCPHCLGLSSVLQIREVEPQDVSGAQGQPAAWALPVVALNPPVATRRSGASSWEEWIGQVPDETEVGAAAERPAPAPPVECPARKGSIERPTFTPSLLVEHPDRRCHSFVTDGRIQFLSDCYHALAGQTVEIPDWDGR